MLPDAELFFGFEDFDFYCRVRDAGFSVLVDVDCARRVAHRQTSAGRDAALRDHRPIDVDEPWRAYYLARNYFALSRRHGRRSWFAWHFVYSARRLQLAGTSAERRAIVRGVVDGARGRLGIDLRVPAREVGERAAPAGVDVATGARSLEADSAQNDRVQSDSPQNDTDLGVVPATPAELGPSVLAMVLSHNAPAALGRCLDAIAQQSVRPGAVLVVDNASEPAVRRATWGRRCRSRCSASDTNLGPAGGWALAFEELQAGSYDFAWVMDDDIVADSSVWRPCGPGPR